MEELGWDTPLIDLAICASIIVVFFSNVMPSQDTSVESNTSHSVREGFFLPPPWWPAVDVGDLALFCNK